MKRRGKRRPFFALITPNAPHDPGEQVNVAGEHPEVIAELRAAHDAWWDSVQAGLVNETAAPPRVNPLKALFWWQHGGGPDAGLAALMDPGSAVAQRQFGPLLPAPPAP